MKISQCMIVKNEEKNIEKALSWGRGVVDEQIVVDTGSTDKTVEIAEKMSAKIYHFEWINDFSAAKNYAIEQCSGDWIAFLDADEYFSDEDAKKLREMLESVDEKYDVIETQLINLDAAGKMKTAATQARLFRNLPYIRYEDAIHEILVCLDRKKNLCYYKINQGFTVFHTGYAFADKASMIEKGNRNLVLLERAIQNDPKNAQNYLYMADSLIVLEEHKRAIECAEKAIEVHRKYNTFLDLRKAYVKALLSNYNYYFSDNCPEPKTDVIKNMERLYNESEREFPNDPDRDYLLGHAYYELKDNEKAAAFFEKCIDKILKNNDLTGIAASMIGLVYFCLANSYFEIRNYEKFVKFAALSIKEQKNRDARLVSRLIFALLGSGETLKSIFEFLSRLYNFESPADFMFVLQGAKMMEPPVLAEYMIKNMPPRLKELIEETEK